MNTCCCTGDGDANTKPEGCTMKPPGDGCCCCNDGVKANWTGPPDWGDGWSTCPPVLLPKGSG